jgi:hypothetical protein
MIWFGRHFPEEPARYPMSIFTLCKLGLGVILLTAAASLPACVQQSNSAELEQMRKDLADAKAAAQSAADSAAESAKAVRAIQGAAGQLSAAPPTSH